MGLGRHLSQQDIELIEAGVHPVIDEQYKVRNSKRIKKKPKNKPSEK